MTDTNTQPAAGDLHNLLCDLAVTAGMRCPEIIAASHALYYWRALLAESCGVEFEVERLRKACKELAAAFAAVDQALSSPVAEGVECAS